MDEVLYGVTSLSPEAASPARLLALHRAHWAIESRVHWVRGMTLDGDRPRFRKGSSTPNMASLRHLAIDLLRMAGASNIASTLHHWCLYTRWSG